MPNIQQILAEIRYNCPYWAPEVRSLKLIDYLRKYGQPLENALRALPKQEQEELGVTGLRWKNP